MVRARLEAWSAQATEKLGFVDKLTEEWIYNNELCKKNAVVTPCTIAADDEEAPEDMEAQEPEPNVDIPAGQVRASEHEE